MCSVLQLTNSEPALKQQRSRQLRECLFLVKSSLLMPEAFIRRDMQSSKLAVELSEADRYTTRLLVKSMPKGAVFSFLRC